MSANKCGCGGTGRRAGLRNQCQRRGGSSPLIRTNDVSVRTSYRTDDMKINQKWLIFFNAKKVIQSLKERMVLEMKLIEKNIDN